jgi:hypothetical protein
MIVALSSLGGKKQCNRLATPHRNCDMREDNDRRGSREGRVSSCLHMLLVTAPCFFSELNKALHMHGSFGVALLLVASCLPPAGVRVAGGDRAGDGRGNCFDHRRPARLAVGLDLHFPCCQSGLHVHADADDVHQIKSLPSPLVTSFPDFQLFDLI